ncbi:hypothetical protein FOA52_005181 [Chlamydomonas sp. UWO 241]|nr:hypothetical protein FOA52_005181 [Chlamydomonas sp. UWO 241]
MRHSRQPLPQQRHHQQAWRQQQLRPRRQHQEQEKQQQEKEAQEEQEEPPRCNRGVRARYRVSVRTEPGARNCLTRTTPHLVGEGVERGCSIKYNHPSSEPSLIVSRSTCVDFTLTSPVRDPTGNPLQRRSDAYLCSFLTECATWGGRRPNFRSRRLTRRLRANCITSRVTHNASAPTP